MPRSSRRACAPPVPPHRRSVRPRRSAAVPLSVSLLLFPPCGLRASPRLRDRIHGGRLHERRPRFRLAALSGDHAGARGAAIRRRRADRKLGGGGAWPIGRRPSCGALNPSSRRCPATTPSCCAATTPARAARRFVAIRRRRADRQLVGGGARGRPRQTPVLRRGGSLVAALSGDHAVLLRSDHAGARGAAIPRRGAVRRPRRRARRASLPLLQSKF